MKKIIITATLCLTTILAMSTSVFADTINTTAKKVPFTVNDKVYDGEYDCYLVDGTTYISAEDLEDIFGDYQKELSQAYVMNETDGDKIIFFPLRSTVTANNGSVEWDSTTNSCNILVSKSDLYNNDDAVLTQEVYDLPKTPVNIDGTNTYLTIHSVAPKITIEEELLFTDKVNELLLAPQKNAISVYENASKKTTREAFTNNLIINNYYEVVSSDEDTAVINLITKVDKNGIVTQTTTTVNIDFENETVKSVK